ncbi:MAG: MOSC domain-containing protein YiiM [Planctomycetaceae bacterium]|jgi:MOSC domain-containing protein YiiM
MKTIRDLKVEHSQNGRVEWIGLCTARRGVVEIVSEAKVEVGSGLVGDHHATSGKSERQVTMIQHEHLPVVAALLNRDEVRPEEVRRNLVVSGINLIALKNQTFHIGDAILEGSGPCVPCSRMTEVLGPGGYNAMRGHGGITVRVLQAGTIRVGDEVVPVSELTNDGEPIEDNDQTSRQQKLFS